jgi:hypothetical protein
MKNQDYTTAIRVDKTPKQVFDANPSPRDEQGFNADLIEKWKLEKQN